MVLRSKWKIITVLTGKKTFQWLYDSGILCRGRIGRDPEMTLVVLPGCMVQRPVLSLPCGRNDPSCGMHTERLQRLRILEDRSNIKGHTLFFLKLKLKCHFIFQQCIHRINKNYNIFHVNQRIMWLKHPCHLFHDKTGRVLMLDYSVKLLVMLNVLKMIFSTLLWHECYCGK